MQRSVAGWDGVTGQKAFDVSEASEVLKTSEVCRPGNFGAMEYVYYPRVACPAGVLKV